MDVLIDRVKDIIDKKASDNFDDTWDEDFEDDFEDMFEDDTADAVTNREYVKVNPSKVAAESSEDESAVPEDKDVSEEDTKDKETIE